MPRPASPDHSQVLQRLQQQQLDLRRQLVETDQYLSFTTLVTANADHHSSQQIPHPSGLARIGGVDVSFAGDKQDAAVAGLVVLSYPDLKVIHTVFRECRFDLPYVAGYLAAREAPILAQMIQELRQSYPKLVPQVIMVDGNGVLHPRRFGLASHLGVIADIPTIGIAKNFLQIDDGAQLTVKAVRERFQACLVRGHRQLILQGESGQIYGMAMCTPATTKPIYVSVGHRISLNTAAMLSQLCCRYRIPEPVRMADLLTRQYIRDHLG